jgi:hypothetical protein
MPRYLLAHRHQPTECSIAYAAWKGFDSPLRHSLAVASCLNGGHAIWWNVEAIDARRALELLPQYVARRTQAIEVHAVETP